MKAALESTVLKQHSLALVNCARLLSRAAFMLWPSSNNEKHLGPTSETDGPRRLRSSIKEGMEGYFAASPSVSRSCGFRCCPAALACPLDR